MNIVSILVILILLGHGIGHIMGFLASWTSLPMGFSDAPWLLSPTVGRRSIVGRAFGLLWLVALIGFVAAGIGIFTRQAWWPTLSVVASILSLVAILPWWNTVTPGPRFWAVVVDVIILVAMLGPWREAILSRVG